MFNALKGGVLLWGVLLFFGGCFCLIVWFFTSGSEVQRLFWVSGLTVAAGIWRFATLYTCFWIIQVCLIPFRDTIYQFLDYTGVFNPFSRHYIPVSGLYRCVSSLFATPYTSFWIIRVRFLPFRDTIYQFLDYTGAFLPFSRHHIPISGLYRCV